MARQRFDIGSKWLLHNQGKGALLVGGLKGVRRIEPLPGEIVQNRKIPDGLLQVYLHGESKPNPCLIEVATYPERRALKQALDLTLAYSALGHLPERTLSAEEFLAKGDVGVVPWVPLMQFEGRPEALLERCAEKIEREAQPKERADLLAVSQVMTGLRFPDQDLLRLLGGQEPMIESPLLQKMMAERSHSMILDILKDRFGAVPRDVTKPVRAILDEKKLRKLAILAAKCPDLEVFTEALLS